MAQKGNVLVVVLALSFLLLVSTLADAGTERTVPASSHEVVTQPKPQAHPKEMVYYPDQGNGLYTIFSFIIYTPSVLYYIRY